ncbi:hypothetical protein KAX97_14880 [candidate division WOR-3 bacterium]|nr:hypothetical protein [candidate division WOR-3 bacterium]
MAKKDTQPKLPSKEQVEKYQLLFPIFIEVLLEVKELSKKNQDGALNKLKIRMINRILEEIKTVLVDQPTSQFLNLLDDETLPTNSDTVLILAQFHAAMNMFHRKYYNEPSGKWSTKATPKQ